MLSIKLSARRRQWFGAALDISGVLDTELRLPPAPRIPAKAAVGDVRPFPPADMSRSMIQKIWRGWDSCLSRRAQRAWTPA